jgi:purine-binding chemotaxis protein CheW
MDIKKVKAAIDDIKAEIDFILLDVQTSQKISDADLDELSKWVGEISTLVEEEEIDNDIFVDSFGLISNLVESMSSKKIELNEAITKILISYFKILPELINLLGDETLTADIAGEVGLNNITEDIEEIIADLKEKEYAEKGVVSVTSVKEKDSKKQVEVSTKKEIILFKLNGVKYGVELNKIQEIIVYPEHITRIPGLQEMVLGVINLRGEVTPLIDLRLWFKTQSKDTIKYSEEDIVISVKNETNKIIGLVIDEVEDVVVIDTKELLPVTQSVDIPTDFLKGLLNYGEKSHDMIVLLDVDALLTEKTLISTVNDYVH